MNARRAFTLVAFVGVALGGEHTRAAEIKGTVRAVSDGIASITAEGDLLPNVGDQAEIFFKLAEMDENISVATGRVQKVDGSSIQVKLENATGQVAIDQLVRISSEKPQKRSAAAGSVSSPAPPSPASLPAAASDEAIRASLVGKWAGKTRDGLQATVVFKPDGTLVVPLQQAPGAMVSGKYSIDPVSNPPRVVVTKLEVVPPPEYTGDELKSFEHHLSLMRRLHELQPGFVFTHQSHRHLAQPVRDAFLRHTWIGEIDDPTHIRIQGFTETEAAAKPKLGAEAGVLIKLGRYEEGPIADFQPLPRSR